MKKQKFKTAIFGATFYGISKLIGNPEDSILIERTLLPGSEFVDSFNEGLGKNIDTTSEFGNTFKNTLYAQGFLNQDGEIYPSPALFLLCDLLQKVPSNILFSTVITAIKEISEGYEITCFNCNGFSTVIADQIIDTTSTGILHDEIKKIDVKKSLNIIVHKPAAASVPCLEPIFHNTLMDLDIFAFQLLPEDDYMTARKKLYTFWLNNRETLEDCKILLTANTFAYRMPFTKIEVKPNITWIPSCGFDNLLHAVDQGQKPL